MAAVSEDALTRVQAGQEAFENSPMLELPTEIFFDILSRLKPMDAFALAMTCRTALDTIENFSYLWNHYHLRSWDDAHIQTSPATASGSKEIVQTREKARKWVRNARTDRRVFVYEHSESLQTLLRALATRRPRGTPGHFTDTNQPRSLTAESMLSIFPPNKTGDHRWAACVYPRESLIALLKQETDCCEIRDELFEKEIEAKQIEAVNATSRTTSLPPRKAKSLKKGKQSNDVTPVPAQHSDQKYQTRLRQLVDEQAAAHLHVLHGVRPMWIDPDDSEYYADWQLDSDRRGKKRKRSRQAKGRTKNDGELINKRLNVDGYTSQDADDAISGHIRNDSCNFDYITGHSRPAPYGVSPPDGETLGDHEAHNDAVQATSPENTSQAALEAREVGEDIPSDDLPSEDEEDESDLESNLSPFASDNPEDNETFEEGGMNGDTDYFGPPSDYLSLGSRLGPIGDPGLRAAAKFIVYDAGRVAWENAKGPFKPFRSGGEAHKRALGPEAHLQPWATHLDEDDEDEGDAAEGIAQMNPQGGSVLNAVAADGAATLADADDLMSNTAMNELQYLAMLEAQEGSDEDDADFVDSDSDSDIEVPIFERHGLFVDALIGEVTAYSGVHIRTAIDAQRETVQAQCSIQERSAASGQSRKSASRRHAIERKKRPWRKTPAVDWVIAESIMVVVHCNLRQTINRDRWGRSFVFPPGSRGDNESLQSLRERQRCRMYPPRGWHLSRGDVSALSDHQSQSRDQHGTEGSSDAADVEKAKNPFDWAGVESATWMGTYFFLDYPTFLSLNSALARRAVMEDDDTSTAKAKVLRELESYGEEHEAVGDCLGLCLNLRPTQEQSPEFEEGWLDAETYGPEDPEFPTLRFAGTTLTYLSMPPEAEGSAFHGAGISPAPPPRPQQRGRAHGFVRPVYSDDPEQQRARYHAPTKQYLPAIAGVQWRIVHAYEGRDRWNLSGVQAGPPGTRAPIYGLWSDVDASIDPSSPQGPFAYFNVDDRPWKQFHALADQMFDEQTAKRNAALRMAARA